MPSIPATLYLVDGDVRVGTLQRFQPEDALYLQTEEGGPALVLPPEGVAAVGLRRATGLDPLPVEGHWRSVDVHLPGDRILTVRVRDEDVSNPLGYYALPESTESPFARYWFYHHGVLARVDREPIGELLVLEELVDPSLLEKGLEEQERERSATIGEILREQESVPGEVIERAAQAQPHMRRFRRPMRLGEILVETGLATQEQVDRALEEQKRRRGRRLGQVLVDMGIVSEEDLTRTLARKFNYPYVDLDEYGVDPRAAAQVPRSLMLRYGMLPVRADENSLTIALADPLAFEGIDMLRFSTRKRIRVVMVTPTQLQRYLQGSQAEEGGEQADDLDSILSLLHQVDERSSTQEAERAQPRVSQEEASELVKLVEHVIIDAWHRGASDIHIEPNGPEREMQIRIRVDGRCETAWRLPARYRQQVVARIKVLANLDIAERRKPQDGKIKLRFQDRKLELRVATLPTVTGDEDVVLRILAGGKPLALDQLGFSERNRREVERAIHQPHGLVLVVGPTGSGKTTTLHALLGAINTEERKIWTAEDPVEITQPGLRQVQMNPRIGLTFASALRAFLRADPDVIMVGEMRDLETASIGVEASLTGHLVFSTLHTNSAPETVIRLVDMGLDPFMFADALRIVLAQRLARRLCERCRVQVDPTPDELAFLKERYGAEALERHLDGRPLKLWKAPGCPHCQGRGYRGRVAIHELLVNDEELKRAIQQKAPPERIRELAVRGGMRTLLQDGIEKALQGLTDLRQVVAVAGT